MKIIFHRRNSLAQLDSTDTKYGVEVDIRSMGQSLIIQHDPFVPGLLFNDWLSHYRHGTLILNVKEEGLEERLISLMDSYNITDYFFLDQSFPFLIKYSRVINGRSAVRISEYENIATALSLAGRINWAWIDYFTRFPLSASDSEELSNAGFSLCLVSPELQGFDPALEVPMLQERLLSMNILVSAVCTKRPDLWETFQ